jgi:hypothetical protein
MIGISMGVKSFVGISRVLVVRSRLLSLSSLLVS